jgi:hypothetical protein
MAIPALKTARAVLERKNEITAYPWWFICDAPKGFVKPKDIPRHIIGPFFSRGDAENEMHRHYYYNKNAFVFCGSGNDANAYKLAVDSAVRLLEEFYDFGSAAEK